MHLWALCFGALAATAQPFRQINFISPVSLAGPEAMVMSVGESKPRMQYINFVPSFDFSHVILIDKDCGEKATNCPKYCGNVILSNLYCPIKCQQQTSQGKHVICSYKVEQNRFDGNSKSARRLNRTEWKYQTAGLYKMYGDFWSELLTTTRNGRNRLEFATRFRLVAASSFDARAMFYSQAFLGLAPGPDSTVPQLAERHQLPHSVMSLSYNRWTLKGKNLRFRILRAGSMDNARCAGWRFVPSLSPHKWVFEIDELTLSGVTLRQRILVIFAFDVPNIIVGTAIAEALQDGGAMLFHRTEFYEEVFLSAADPHKVPKSDLKLEFRSGDQTLSLDGQSIVAGMRRVDDKWRYELRIRTSRRNPHHNSDVIVLGHQTVRGLCTAFDYETNRIGFGKLRRWAFPYNEVVGDE